MKTYLTELYNNVINILFEPPLFWEKQKESFTTNIQLLAGYLIPLIFFAAIGVFAGEMFRGSRFYLFFPVIKAVRKIVLFTVYYIVMVIIINEMMPAFGIKKDLPAAQKLAAFSLTPAVVIAFITGLFPFLYILNILGIYGFYIFWTGINILLDFSDNKQYSYFLLIIIAGLIVFSLLSIFLSKLLTVIL
jgi:hypothetical protein